ncbi:hypothetical protein IAD21_04623 [Abditibacteriota bacterium]|nr:hypothetical protein IAD21_04623 [Abditibacteriota bacterium]
MDPYFSFFLVGSVGLSFMALLGVAGGHGHHQSSGHGHDAGGFHLHGTGGHGHSHGHSDVGIHHTPVSHTATVHGHASHGAAANGHGAHQHGHHSHGREHGGHHEGGFNLKTAVLSWLSPRVLLTMSMGIGATGVLVANTLPDEPLRGLASLAGGVALEKLIVSPLWNVLTRFASKPARTLDSAVLEEATAITGFDASGCGLVSINLDGHEMRLLGRLAPEHKQERVRTGDTLIVESVDGARGQCVVSPISMPLREL